MPTRPPIHQPAPRTRKDRSEAQREYDRTRRQNRDVYGTMRWRRLSEAHRTQHPLCCQCLQEGRTQPADVVDHITPISLDKAKAFDPNNLQSLCSKCHAIKTARDGERAHT